MDHVVSSVQLMVAALIAFWIFIPKLEPKIKISVDTDWFYRRPLIAVVNGLVWVVCTARETLASNGMYMLKQVLPFFNNPLKWAPQTVQGEVVGDYDENKYRFPVGLTVLMSILVFVVTVSYIWFL